MDKTNAAVLQTANSLNNPKVIVLEYYNRNNK